MSREPEMDDKEIDDLLAYLDDPLPRISAQQLIEAARAGDTQLIEAARAEDARPGLEGARPGLEGARPGADAARSAGAVAPRASWMKWAAGIALALGVAGAAYAMPGSPLPGWLDALRGGASGVRSGEVDVPAPPPPKPDDPSGIAVDPGEALTITFETAQSRGRLAVTLTDGSEVVVRAVGGADAPSFTSGLDRLVVDNRASSADIDIEIPRSARNVEVRVGGRRALLSEVGRVTAEVSPDPDGRYVLPWSGGGA